MINHRNKQNFRFRTWKIRDRCHLKGGVRQGCFQSLILNYLFQYIHFHSLYITSHYHAKFKENPCVGTDARPPFPFLDGDVPRSPSYGVYISQVIRFARECSNFDDFNNRNLFLTATLIKQDYRYNKIRDALSKFCHRHPEIIVKCTIGLKTLLQQGISEPIFYGEKWWKTF